MELFGRVVIAIIAISIGGWSSSYCVKNNFTLGRSFIHGFIFGAVSVIGIMIALVISHLLGFQEVQLDRLVKGSVFIVIFGVVVGGYSAYRVLISRGQHI